MSKTEKQEIGAWGEQYAQEFLRSQGYDILQCNYSVKVGEIDIVASCFERRYGRTLSFVEVKTRTEKKITGMAERSVGKSKRAKFLAAAKWYCLEHGINVDKTPIQFEQISVYREKGQIVCRKYVLPM